MVKALPKLKAQEFDNLPQPVVAIENRWPSGASTGWHEHPRCQLLYATEGVMVVQSDGGTWVVPPNRALWMQPRLRHNVIMSGDVHMRTAYIDADRITGLPPESCVINVSPLLRELLVQAVQIAPSAEASHRDALVLDLLVCEFRVSPALPLHLPMPTHPKLRALCTELMARPADTTSAAEWAALLGVGERTLHRLFSQQTGMTFAHWREQARLLHALQRMAEGDKLISVSLDCGYNSLSAFAAMFKRHFGMPPSAFYQ